MRGEKEIKKGVLLKRLAISIINCCGSSAAGGGVMTMVIVRDD